MGRATLRSPRRRIATASRSCSARAGDLPATGQGALERTQRSDGERRRDRRRGWGRQAAISPSQTSIPAAPECCSAVATGTFSRPTEFATGRFPVALAAADIAGDSATDLAVANRSSHDVAVIRKLGDKLPDPADVLTLGKHEPTTPIDQTTYSTGTDTTVGIQMASLDGGAGLTVNRSVSQSESTTIPSWSWESRADPASRSFRWLFSARTPCDARPGGSHGGCFDVQRRRRRLGEAAAGDVAGRDPDERLRPLGRPRCGPGRDPCIPAALERRGQAALPALEPDHADRQPLHARRAVRLRAPGGLEPVCPQLAESRLRPRSLGGQPVSRRRASNLRAGPQAGAVPLFEVGRRRPAAAPSACSWGPS